MRDACPHGNDAAAGAAAVTGVTEEVSARSTPSQPQSPPPPYRICAVVVDRRIDCIIGLQLGDLLRASAVIPLAIRLRRAGSNRSISKDVTRTSSGAHCARRTLSQLRVAGTTGQSLGPLNELEFSEFVGGVHQLGMRWHAAAEFPEMAGGRADGA